MKKYKIAAGVILMLVGILPNYLFGYTDFSDVSAQAGVADTSHSRGVAWGDYNNDGYLDIYVCNNGRNTLYRNNGDGTFTDVAEIAGVRRGTDDRSAIWGDYDNDGDLDLYVTTNGRNTLYRNNGDGTFTDVTDTAGVRCGADSRGATWIDFDNDGYLDLYVCNWNANNTLYRNVGDGTFVDVSNLAGVQISANHNISASWGDYNNDGYIDLLVMRMYLSTSSPGFVRLYRNNGDGTFTNVTNQVGIPTIYHGESAAWGDFNNDGLLDFILVGDQSTIRFFFNDGDGTFTNYTHDAGLSHPGCENLNNVSVGDYNKDGYLDIVITAGCGIILYKNNGDSTFTKVTNIAGIGNSSDNWAAAWGDYDNDGDIDLYITNATGANFLYRNNGNLNNWLQIRLIGKISNKSAIGAKVKIKAH